jgi:transcriptional regulator GlxA family with amidase domain
MTEFQAEIKDRLAQTLIRLRLAKLRQIVERTGHPLEDILFIKKLELGWRLGHFR